MITYNFGMNEKRIYPSRKSLIKTIVIFSIVILILLYAAFSSRFAWAYDKEGNISGYIIQDIAILLIWIVLTSIASYILLTKNYYVLTKVDITHHKLNQEVTYSFSSILYIDEEYTKKHNTILFYLNTGRSVFLVLDDKNEVLDAINKGAKNLISRQEFHAKFPKIRL